MPRRRGAGAEGPGVTPEGEGDAMHRLKWAGIVIPVFVVAAVLGLGTFWWQPVGATGEPAYRVYLPVVFGQPTAPPTPTPSVRLELVSTPYVYQLPFTSSVYVVVGEV